MSDAQSAIPLTQPDTSTSVARGAVEREAGRHGRLGAGKVAMSGLGCPIGRGLFLGIAIPANLAGPAVILSFVIGGLIALTVMWALAEMSAEHPTAGAFGVHAEMYL